MFYIFIEQYPGYFKIIDVIFNDASDLSKGLIYPYEGSVIEEVFKQETNIIVGNSITYVSPVDRQLFAAHGCASHVLVPLIFEGYVSGVLALASKKAGFFEALFSGG